MTRKAAVDWTNFACPKVGRVILTGGAYMALKRKVFKRDNHRCVICGNLAVDLGHVIGRWNVRRDTEDNTAAVCRKCNDGQEDGTVKVEWEIRDGVPIVVKVFERNNPEHPWVRVK